MRRAIWVGLLILGLTTAVVHLSPRGDSGGTDSPKTPLSVSLAPPADPTAQPIAIEPLTELRKADEVVVIESDANEDFSRALGAGSAASDSPSSLAQSGATHDSIGVGGGSGGSYGVRMGGKMSRKAYGGGGRGGNPGVEGAESIDSGNGASREGASLLARDAAGQTLGQFPLKHTTVKAGVAGYIASVEVEQQYENPFEKPIEAVYVFPLPNLAAVNGFVMEVAGRKIVGIVRPRAEAEKIYAEAKARGQTASLLTQERPNIFTQSVANIEPGKGVDIRITYFEQLRYEAGQYEFVFPMVVGPRYIPGSPLAGDAAVASGKPSGGGTSPNTTIVADASKITPPVVPPLTRSGHDISLTLDIDAGFPIRGLEVPTHTVSQQTPRPSRRIVTLSPEDSIANRDFVCRWRVDGDETQFGVLAHRGPQGGFLTLMMQPELAPGDAEVTPREITFIIDRSGSMSGIPLDMSRQIVTRTLDRLRPSDLFNIIYFASGNAQLWESARLSTPQNIVEAKQFLGNLTGSGGTEMLSGLQRALHAPHEAQYLQMCCFLTDGYVGDEARILETIEKERGAARFFAFGPGSSVNRYLLDGIGEIGHGATQYANPRDATGTEKCVNRFFEAIDSPVLVDLSIDWNGLPVTEVYPRRIPDLFAGQTVNVVGRFDGKGPGTAYICGRVGARKVRLPVAVNLPGQSSGLAALAPLWARRKIHDLSAEMLTAPAEQQDGIVQQITSLGVEFRLVTPYTAFVAVDESRVVGDGKPIRILQPVEMPEGVSREGVFGEGVVGRPVSVKAWGLVLVEEKGGKVRVNEVQAGPAQTAGVAAGNTLTLLNGTKVSGLQHLESLLLQAGGREVVVDFSPAAAEDPTAGRPVRLPMP